MNCYVKNHVDVEGLSSIAASDRRGGGEEKSSSVMIPVHTGDGHFQRPNFTPAHHTNQQRAGPMGEQSMNAVVCTHSGVVRDQWQRLRPGVDYERASATTLLLDPEENHEGQPAMQGSDWRGNQEPLILLTEAVDVNTKSNGRYDEGSTPNFISTSRAGSQKRNKAARHPLPQHATPQQQQQDTAQRRRSVSLAMTDASHFTSITERIQRLQATTRRDETYGGDQTRNAAEVGDVGDDEAVRALKAQRDQLEREIQRRMSSRKEATNDHPLTADKLAQLGTHSGGGHVEAYVGNIVQTAAIVERDGGGSRATKSSTASFHETTKPKNPTEQVKHHDHHQRNHLLNASADVSHLHSRHVGYNTFRNADRQQQSLPADEEETQTSLENMPFDRYHPHHPEYRAGVKRPKTMEEEFMDPVVLTIRRKLHAPTGTLVTESRPATWRERFDAERKAVSEHYKRVVQRSKVAASPPRHQDQMSEELSMAAQEAAAAALDVSAEGGGRDHEEKRVLFDDRFRANIETEAVKGERSNSWVTCTTESDGPAQHSSHHPPAHPTSLMNVSNDASSSTTTKYFPPHEATTTMNSVVLSAITPTTVFR